jgi:hypothetical protein
MMSPLTDDDTLDRRLRLRFAADEIDAKLNRRPVRILDISLTGLGFETTQRIDLQGTYELHLDTELGPLRLSGRILWCRGAGIVDTEERPVTPLYRAGLRFGPLGVEDARRLHKLLCRKAEGSDLQDEETTSEFSREEVERQRQQSAPEAETTRSFTRDEIARALREAME